MILVPSPYPISGPTAPTQAIAIDKWVLHASLVNPLWISTGTAHVSCTSLTDFSCVYTQDRFLCLPLGIQLKRRTEAEVSILINGVPEL